jgi:phospholipid/cholesterol/gamma-HCH transport system permease protein
VTAPALPENQAPAAQWLGGGGTRWTLALAGDWQRHADALPPAPAEMGDAAVAIDGRALQGWDAAFVARLWQLVQGVPRRQLQLDGLPDSLRKLLELALPAGDKPVPATAPVAAPRLSPHAWLAAVGAGSQRAWGRGRLTLTFFGQVLLGTARLLRGRSRMRRSDLVWQLEQAGPRSVPIVSLVSALSGLILGYMGAAQLQRFGAQSFIADLVTVGAVREMAALMTGVILAGRIGAAYAAQLGSMQANEEIDAVRALGVDPVELLVLPRVLAMLLAAPLLIAYAALVTMVAGGAVAIFVFHVPALEYIFKSAQALTLPDMLIGLLKGTVYSVLVAMAGCRQGLNAGRSAQAVGGATTMAVVQAIVWMVVAASALTVVFQRLGW